MKEYKVGEIFGYKGKVFQCVEDSTEVGCGSCCALRGDCDKCLCSCEERQDETNVHFVEVTELKDGMMFRAENGKLYRFSPDIALGEDCSCMESDCSCSKILKQIKALTGDNESIRVPGPGTWFLPVEESAEESDRNRDKDDKVTSDPDKFECARHISLFVIEVKEGEVYFRIDEQTHRGSNFSNQLDSRRFAGKNGYKLVSSSCPEWWADNHCLFVRGDTLEDDEELLVCNLEEFAKISEVVSEYNRYSDIAWPDCGDTYYYLTRNGEVSSETYRNEEFDNKLKDYGNFFVSRAEAEEAGKRVREALRDE